MTAAPQLDDLTTASASALAGAIRAKQISAVEAVEACLARIAQVNPTLNAVVQIAAERALSEARAADAALALGELCGPLHGVPVTIKDAFETEGIVSTGGTKGRSGYVPAQDATAVARLRAAGAIVLGKTNVPELSLAFETDNLVYGRTNNPFDPARTPGGSSGGEAAIIAAGGSPLGIGSDAAGSIRWPAHCCGIAGLKPTRGRVPLTGHFPPAVGHTALLWQAGPLARRVEDLALALRVLAGPDGHDPNALPASLGEPAAVQLDGLRLALYTDDGVQPAAAEIAATVRSAGTALAAAGVRIAEERPAGIEQTFALAMGLFGADGGAGVRTLLQLAGTAEPSPFIMRFGHDLQPFALASAAEFSGLLARIDLWQMQMLAIFERYDAILCPVNAAPALPHGQSWEQIAGFGYTVAHNLTGWPAAVVRAGTTADGLPIGVQLVAPPWREDVALALAAAVEAACGPHP
jgi:amidase